MACLLLNDVDLYPGPEKELWLAGINVALSRYIFFLGGGGGKRQIKKIGEGYNIAAKLWPHCYKSIYALYRAVISITYLDSSENIWAW